jgi:hypothetical protein
MNRLLSQKESELPASLSDLTKWIPIFDPVRSWQGNQMCLKCRTHDPQLVSPKARITTDLTILLLLRMSVSCEDRVRRSITLGSGIYWATGCFPEFDEKRCIRFPVFTDGAVHDYVVPLTWDLTSNETIIQLRWDPVNFPGTCVVHGFTIVEVP